VGLSTWKFEVKRVMDAGEFGDTNDNQACLQYLYFSYRVVTRSRLFYEPAGGSSIPSDEAIITACLEVAYKLVDVERETLDAACSGFKYM